MRRLIILAAALAAVLGGSTSALAGTPAPLAGVTSITSGQCYRVIPTAAGYGNIAYAGTAHRFITKTGGAFTDLCFYRVSTNIWQIQAPFDGGKFAGYYDHGPLGDNIVTEQTGSYTNVPSWQQWFFENDGGGQFDVYNEWTLNNPDPNCVDGLGNPSTRDLGPTGAGLRIDMQCQDIPNHVYNEWFVYSDNG